MPKDPGLDLILIADSDYHPGGASDHYGPMNEYFIAPLARLGLPHPYSLPNPPSLGVAALATYLRRSGAQVQVFENVLRLPGQRARLFAALEHAPAAVGISTTSLFSAGSVARLAGWVRERAPAAKIVLGGFHAARSEAMRALADVTVVGEGEQTLQDLLTAIKSGASWEDIPNLVWQEQGRRRATPRRANLDIAGIPPPDWDLLDASPAHCYGIEASRGCRYDCAFCAVPDKGNQRLRPVAEVVAEMRRDRERYGISLLSFVDSNFTSYPEHALALCQAIAAADLKIRWRCYARADDFTRLPALAAAMKAAGCEFVTLGLESGSDDILRRMHKGCTRAQMQEGVRLAKAAGLHVYGIFIIGFPGESPATVAETLGFIKSSGIDTVYLNLLGVTEELQEDARRRADRHAGLTGSKGRWSHAGMDSAQAKRLAADCVDAVSLTMARPLLAFQRLIFYYMLAGGLSMSDSMELLESFRDYRRAERRADPALGDAALRRIRGLYSRMLAGYPSPAPIAERG